MSSITLENKTILVTGAAGFIGAHLIKKIFETAPHAAVIGIDNMNPYYDVSIKEKRLRKLMRCPAFTFVKGSIADKALLSCVFEQYRPQIVVNLAAQAGVRYSIENPDAYVESNLVGFFHILESCRRSYDHGAEGVSHLIYASSSSVYGDNKKIPYSVKDQTDHPVSLYAATKKSDELLAYAYAKLYGIPSTGLRFFTVYGPEGRPDMAYFHFADQLREGKTIQLFNYGRCRRDFTYIDDITEGIIRVMQKPPQREIGDDGLKTAPHKIYNIGNSHPENLMDFVDILQQELVRAGVLPEDYDFAAHTQLVPMQPGDVPVTYADTSELERDFGFRPCTSVREGLRAFSQWYRTYSQEKSRETSDKGENLDESI